MNLRHLWFSAAALAALAVGVGCTSGPTGSAGGGRPAIAKAEFVGSKACQDCHEDEYKTWQNTYHNKMVRPAREGLLKDAVDNWAKDAKGNAGPTKANITGTPAKLDDVQFVIGSKWKQRFLVKNPSTGNHQFLDKQWNRGTQAWEPYGQKNDWETQCSTCHATGFRILSYDAANPAAMKVTMSEKNTGCEACHGPGSVHAKSKKARDIFNPRKVSKAEADKVCGYCHIRAENSNWLTAQGNKSEHLPHPVLGESYKAGQDDWTKWYPDKVLLVGIQPEDSVKVNHPNTDLNNAFFIDEAAQKSGLFEARKHHQQYQEHLMTKHAQKGEAGCLDCHMLHSVEGKKALSPQETCNSCHKDGKADYKALMPGLAQTAGGLFMRSHTFNPNPRKGGLTGDQLPPPVYAYPAK